jgi:hypothetical protein
MNSIIDPSGNRLVFCEGKPDGFDYLLWKRILIEEIHPDVQDPLRIQIEPLGGKQAAKNYARGYTRDKIDNWVIIRDRDLDEEFTGGTVPITWDKGTIILTGYTCLESYFLSPELLDRYLDHKKIGISDGIANTLQDTLEELRDYQAVRWGLQKIRRIVRASGQALKPQRRDGLFDLPNRLTEDDGTLPPNLATCVEDGKKLCSDFNQLFMIVDPDQFHTFYLEYLNRFDGDSFWNNEFKYWFHGKDVLKRWIHILKQRYKIDIGYDAYCKWCLANMDWQQHPDLIEIQRICQSRVD